MIDESERVILRLRAAGEATRLRILALLRQGDLSVGELVQILGLSQPRLSHQLKVLAGAGLVTRLPEGSWVFYRAATTGPEGEIVELALKQANLSAGVFLRDFTQLKSIESDRANAARQYFDSVAETWDTIRSLHYPTPSIESAVLEAGGAGPFKQVIDIGTGTGRMLSLFASRARSMEGLDLSHKMLTVARDNLAKANIGHAAVRHGDACIMPFDSEVADLVIVHQVLHYVDQPWQVLSEADRILAPGGRLVVVDFAPHDLEFLRNEHGHRRLGIPESVLADWCHGTSLRPQIARKFDPPPHAPKGLSVQIWTADKPGTSAGIPKETAA